MLEWSNVYQWALNVVGKEIALVILTITGTILFHMIYRKLWIITAFFMSRSRALSAVKRVHTKDGPREGKGLWLQPTSMPDNYENSFGTRVLVIANNKGGVAKTTLAANLGAYWAREWNKRVLLIDLDYQSTLSSMALRKIDWLPKRQDSVATRVISGDLEPDIFVHCAKDIPGEDRLKIIPAYYDLAQADNRLIVEWLLDCKPRSNKSIVRALANFLTGKLFVRKDVRYNLAELLQTSAVRNAFDIVIIDCPPRVTTGVIQALCAGTHVLIPTLLDLPSAESVVSFCEELETLKKAKICPKLQYVGVVGTKVSSQVNQVAEVQALNFIDSALEKQGFPSGLQGNRVKKQMTAA